MLAMAGVTMMALAVIVLFPETDFARLLRRWLIEAPARALNRASMWRIAFWSALIGTGIAMTMLFEAEGAILYGMMAPEVMAYALMFDVGVLIDALLITTAVLAANGVRVARTQGVEIARRIISSVVRTSARAQRSRPTAARPTRKTSDDEGPGWVGQPYRAFSMA